MGKIVGLVIKNEKKVPNAKNEKKVPNAKNENKTPDAKTGENGDKK